MDLFIATDRDAKMQLADVAKQWRQTAEQIERLELKHGCHARISAKFRKLFYLCSMRIWQPRGRERDELRGSFLPLKSNAGGNRARGHQRRATEISLDTLTVSALTDGVIEWA
jgi:hypothetical protein